jgi:ABC-type multidrug transport system permease subunit
MGESSGGWRTNPLVQLTLTRFREFYREPVAIFWVYGFPLILAVILGLAFQNRPVERIPVDVRSDGPGGPAAAERAADALRGDGRLKVTVSDGTVAANRLRTAKTDLVVVPGADPAAAGEYVYDPNRVEAVLARAAADNVLLRLRTPGLPAATLTEVSEPGSRYIDFLIPGLLGINLMGGGLFGVGFQIVNLRVRKLLKRFLATPMRRSDFLLSLAFSRLVFTLIELVLLLTFAWLTFGVKVRGSPAAFAALVLLGAVSFSGLGLLVASRAQTLETVSGLVNALMLPMYMLSGVFFAWQRFPEAVHPFIRALPLTALIDGLRAVMNDGGGFEAIAGPAAVLAVWGVVSFALAVRLFRWR